MHLISGFGCCRHGSPGHQTSLSIDLLGSWYREPNNFFRATLALVSQSEAKRVVGHEAIADVSLITQRGYLFYFYTRQKRLMAH